MSATSDACALVRSFVTPSLVFVLLLATSGCNRVERRLERDEPAENAVGESPAVPTQPCETHAERADLPEDAIGFEFAVVRKGANESSLEDHLEVLRRRLEVPQLFELVQITSQDEQTVRIWVRARTESAAEIEEFLCRLFRPHVLEFRVLAEPNPAEPDKYDRFRRQLHEEGPTPHPGDEFGWFAIDHPVRFFNLDTPADLESFDVRNARQVVEKYGDDYYVLAELSPKEALLADDESWHIQSARVDRDLTGRPCVSLDLDETGGRLLKHLTRRNIHRALCILLTDRAVSAPTIQSVVGEHVQISGDFSPEKAQRICSILQTDNVPFRLKFVGRVP